MDEFTLANIDNPKKVNKESYYSLVKMGKIRFEGKNKFLSNLGIISMVVAAIVVILSGIKNIEILPLGLFGFVFFAAGYSVGMVDSALIALFTHGFIGFCVMNGGAVVRMLGVADNNPIVYLVIIVASILAIASLIFGVIYHYSSTLKINIVAKSIPVMLAVLATVIVHFTLIILQMMYI